MIDNQKECEIITKLIMKAYQDGIHNYIIKHQGKLNEPDVVLMIMNLVVNIPINIYYTLKQIMPNATIDFDFMKAKMCNHLIDGFEKIKEYNPEETMMTLNEDQVKEVCEKGFTIITNPDGSERRVEMSEVMIKKEDVEKHLSTPRIITHSNGLLQ